MTKRLSKNNFGVSLRMALTPGPSPKTGEGSNTWTAAKLIIGCGYLGRRVAGHWLDAGNNVVALTRSAAKAEDLKGQGIRPLVADITQPATLHSLPEAKTVLFAVGYDAACGRPRKDFYVEGLQAVLQSLSPKTNRFILISSTAVYGQTDGQWVDEDSPCQPKTEGGAAFLEAENALAASQFGQRSVILRLAGLYGPGRLSRRIKDLQKGKQLLGASERFLNLIHVEDAAAVVVAAEIHARPPRTYIVADGRPLKYRDYLTYLAMLVGRPNHQDGESSSCLSNQPSRMTNKRLSNARMLTELGVQLKYPTYEKGLKAIFLL
jgi:nucleoside-diphosphate-sugar epimerase